MLPLLFMFLAGESLAAKPLPTLDELQYEECTALARKDPASAVSEASAWAQKNGGFLARGCQGIALARDFKFEEALPVLIEAAKGADAKKDQRAPRYWAMAGNAAITAGMPDQALTAIDTALASPVLVAAERAECLIDRARALVNLKRDDDAAKALAEARQLAPENGTAWLLSATLARRDEKLPEALAFIQTAAATAPQDPAVALEAGNIAAAAGDDTTARKQWEQVIALAPKSRQAETAQSRLAELPPESPAAPETTPQSR